MLHAVGKPDTYLQPWYVASERCSQERWYDARIHDFNHLTDAPFFAIWCREGSEIPEYEAAWRFTNLYTDVGLRMWIICGYAHVCQYIPKLSWKKGDMQTYTSATSHTHTCLHVCGIYPTIAVTKMVQLCSFKSAHTFIQKHECAPHPRELRGQCFLYGLLSCWKPPSLCGPWGGEISRPDVAGKSKYHMHVQLFSRIIAYLYTWYDFPPHSLKLSLVGGSQHNCPKRIAESIFTKLSLLWWSCMCVYRCVCKWLSQAPGISTLLFRLALECLALEALTVLNMLALRALASSIRDFSWSISG